MGIAAIPTRVVAILAILVSAGVAGNANDSRVPPAGVAGNANDSRVPPAGVAGNANDSRAEPVLGLSSGKVRGTAGCSDPASYLAAGLASLGACASRPSRPDASVPAGGLVCLQDLGGDFTSEERRLLAEHCRTFDGQLKAMAADPGPHVASVAGAIAKFAWTVISVPGVDRRPNAAATIEVMNDLWGRSGPVGAAMTDSAWAEFIAPRMPAVGDRDSRLPAAPAVPRTFPEESPRNRQSLGLPAEPAVGDRTGSARESPARVPGPSVAPLIDRGLEQLAMLSGESAGMGGPSGRPAWSWTGLVRVDRREPGGEFTTSPGAVRIRMAGRFDGAWATDLNPLGLVVEQWSETLADIEEKTK